MGNSLGQNIKDLRKKNQFSQVELAKMMNISPQAISKWENDKSIPDIVTINTLATIFNTSIENLIESEVTVTECLESELINDTDLKINESRKNSNISKPELAEPVERSLDSSNAIGEIPNSKRWINPIGFFLNFLLYLYLCNFFYFEHPIIQFAIIISLYLGFSSSYYLVFQLINKKYINKYFLLVSFLNVVIFLALVIYYVIRIISTIS